MIKLEFNHKIGKKYFYNFQCKCGNKKILRSDSKAKFCCMPGCSFSERIRHGKSSTRLYNIWSGIRSRCIHDSKDSHNYRDRGVSVCSEWDDFSVFSEWSNSNGYAENLTIDRIDIDGNYSPSNCEWVTREENTRRQSRDGHGNGIKVILNGATEFVSIFKASEYIAKKGIDKTKAGSIRVILEKRIRSGSKKPYKGFVIERVEQ